MRADVVDRAQALEDATEEGDCARALPALSGPFCGGDGEVVDNAAPSGSNDKQTYEIFMF